MRSVLILMSALIFFMSFEAVAESPPFPTVTIEGNADTKFNKVSLFEGGSSKKPYKSVEVSEVSGQYSININIPSDMRKKDQYYLADMRFWGDTNKNGIIDEGEPLSECHFVMWVPSAKQVYMQIYNGSKYIFDSPSFTYFY